MHAFLGNLALWSRRAILLFCLLLLLIGCNRSAFVDVMSSEEADGEEIETLLSQAVVSFTLINADNNRPIRGFDPIRSGAVLDLSALPTTRLNIRANTKPTPVGSVRFSLNGRNIRTDSSLPYALAGDSRGNYRPWTPAPGRYSLTATPYVRSGARGSVGKALTIRFEVKGAQDGAAAGLKWTTVRPAPLGVNEAQGLALGDKLYVFGGYTSWRPYCTTTRAHVYDAAKNAWTKLPDMPEPWTHAGTASDGRNIFLVGGYANKPNCNRTEVATRTVYRFDTQKKTWHSDLPPLPDARGSGGLAYLGGALHFFGGTNNKRVDKGDHWVLAPGAKKWTKAAPLPQPRSHMGVTVLDGKIYAIGGQTGFEQGAVMLRHVHVYDPGSDRWTARASLPKPLSHIAAATLALNDRIVVLGGERKHNDPVNEVLSYEPTRNRWSALAPMPARSRAGVAGVIGGKVVYSGGHTFVKRTFQATVQK